MNARATEFEVIPAIDLLDGRAVRLAQGRYEDATVYDDRPALVAGRFVAAGATRIHVVDLDGAKAGRPVNGVAIRKVVSAAGRVPVQLGGGLRTLAAVESALELDVDRVILGTAALRDPDLVRDAARRFPGRIVVGIDAKDGRVAVEGWLEASDVAAVDLARAFEDAGVAAIVYTDIARDGMLGGPNLDATVALARAVAIPVVVSGGVATVDDLVAAARRAGDGIAGAIVGRALYTGAIDLEAALERVGAERARGAGEG
ncbi:MAG: 1-(5-phosphoribosyl)-5-[(5-phosphoribosylamino)methylideneamino]imidazole-4-carboxamide isomerase [Myxococcales bacterium]|nr:1-(5-phosphoribosyl)-5-[(5-phosphoribosylamino)methylideneamino]imidazole-4-carboxamide isomerase [Myxococcales bacterium]